jgi:hypothetical protein
VITSRDRYGFFRAARLDLLISKVKVWFASSQASAEKMPCPIRKVRPSTSHISIVISIRIARLLRSNTTAPVAHWILGPFPSHTAMYQLHQTPHQMPQAAPPQQGLLPPPLRAEDVELQVRQEPRKALLVVEGREKGRKPVDPPPVIQLRVTQAADPNRYVDGSPAAGAAATTEAEELTRV